MSIGSISSSETTSCWLDDEYYYEKKQLKEIESKYTKWENDLNAFYQELLEIQNNLHMYDPSLLHCTLSTYEMQLIIDLPLLKIDRDNISRAFPRFSDDAVRVLHLFDRLIKLETDIIDLINKITRS